MCTRIYKSSRRVFWVEDKEKKIVVVLNVFTYLYRFRQKKKVIIEQLSKKKNTTSEEKMKMNKLRLEKMTIINRRGIKKAAK